MNEVVVTLQKLLATGKRKKGGQKDSFFPETLNLLKKTCTQSKQKNLFFVNQAASKVTTQTDALYIYFMKLLQILRSDDPLYTAVKRLFYDQLANPAAASRRIGMDFKAYMDTKYSKESLEYWLGHLLLLNNGTTQSLIWDLRDADNLSKNMDDYFGSIFLNRLPVFIVADNMYCVCIPESADNFYRFSNVIDNIPGEYFKGFYDLTLDSVPQIEISNSRVIPVKQILVTTRDYENDPTDFTPVDFFNFLPVDEGTEQVSVYKLFEFRDIFKFIGKTVAVKKGQSIPKIVSDTLFLNEEDGKFFYDVIGTDKQHEYVDTDEMDEKYTEVRPRFRRGSTSRPN